MRLKVAKPVGCESLILRDEGEALRLALLVVRAGRRRQGVGTEALRRVKELAARLGKPVLLKVDRPRQVSLKRFYGERGFRQIGTLEMEWRPAQ